MASEKLVLPEGLTGQELIEIYKTMILVRTLDERVWAMNRQGKAALVASCQGHEAAQLASVWGIRKNTEDRFFFTYYRDLAVFVAQGLSPVEVMLGYLAKAGEPLSGARQFPLHGADLSRKVMNLSNVVGSHVSQAVGWALACRLQGQATVVGVYFGDGATSQGDIHEAMNYASVHRLPVIFMCENNRYAISVPIDQQMAIPNVAVRAAGYGMPGITVDGTDVVAVYNAVAEAAKLASMDGGPSLIEFRVERYLPHTSDDDDSVYRSREDIEQARTRDPLLALQTLLRDAGMLDVELDNAYRTWAKKEVDEATDIAEAAPFPDASSFFNEVYADVEGDKWRF